MLAIRLPAELEVRLEKLAKRTGRTRTFHARGAIEAYLNDREDPHVAEQIKRRIDSGEERTYTLDDVETHLDLAD